MKFAVNYGGRVYRIAPSMGLLLEVEEELGPAPDLAARLGDGSWRAGEVVALYHIFLQTAGKTADYMALGDEMMQQGLAARAAEAARFFNHILNGETA